jgi:hypothetical protein
MPNNKPLSRDPRIDPRPGDVLLLGNNRISVTELTKQRVLYELTTEGAKSVIERMPMNCSLYLNFWEEVVDKAEVIHASK